MAEDCEALARLTAEREDLFALHVLLQEQDFKPSPAQLVDAHNLILGLRLTGTLPPDRRNWAPYLAPIFCRSAEEQARFHRIFSQWLGGRAIPANDVPPSVELPKPKADRRPWLLPGLAALLAVWLATIGSIELPLPSPSQPRVERPQQLEPTTPNVETEAKPAATRPVTPTRPPESIPAQTSFGWTAEQVLQAVAGLPLAVWLVWVLWAWFDRRLLLTRRSGPQPEGPHTRWVRGVAANLFEPADLRELVGRFGLAERVPSRRLDEARTVAATVRRAGLFTPVNRERCQTPAYLVLIERTGLPQRRPAVGGEAIRDHLAAYGQSLIDFLRAEQIPVAVYHFNGDPRACWAADGRLRHVNLAGLASRHSDARLILMTDAASLFETLSFRPVNWLGDFEVWPERIVLTPRPLAEWGAGEATLALRGFAVAPAHPSSLRLLARLWLPAALDRSLSEVAKQRVRLLAPVAAEVPELPRSIRRVAEGWLYAEPRAPGGLAALLDDLRDYLGADGFRLLQALAVYPELTWPLTLYVDWRLYGRTAGDANRRARRLLRLSRLPWLRIGRLPDYFRMRLIRLLAKPDYTKIAAFYVHLLEAQDRQGPGAIALELGPPPPAAFVERLRRWFVGRRGIYADRIFAKVVLGGRPNWLDIELPQWLARLLPGVAWDGASARLFVSLAAALMPLVGLALASPVLEPLLDGRLRLAERARHAPIAVTVAVADGAEAQASALVAALARGGFRSVQVTPVAPGSANGSPPVSRVASGPGAGQAGDWIAARVRYLEFSRDAATPGPVPGSGAPALAGQVHVALAAGPAVFQDETPPDEPDMVEIPAGEFWMGSPDDEGGRDKDEGPRHRVRIARPFALARHEVTFAEYARFVRETGREMPDDQGWGRGHRPVINVSWRDAQAYAEWLSQRTGKTYRLPTEAEWEYAARAGTETARYWGQDEGEACAHANVADLTAQAKNSDWTIFSCSDGYAETAPVGSYLPNAFGLFDMLGNVWEWVADCYQDSYKDAAADGTVREEKDCSLRVLRGGSWFDGPGVVRAAGRGRVDPGGRSGDVGFRLARTLN